MLGNPLQLQRAATGEVWKAVFDLLVKAALRHQANAAKLFSENPTLLRLRELEAVEKIASAGNSTRSPPILPKTGVVSLGFLAFLGCAPELRASENFGVDARC